ncbi:MAG: hypothetical protein ACPG4Z_04820 [Chitinophagales bacterium]
MKNLVFLFSICILLMACQSQESTEQDATEETIEIPSVIIYETLPVEHIEQLHSTCDMIEATFYLTSQSMNTASTQDFLNMFDFSTAPTTLNTSDSGHILFLAEGNQILLGKISLSSTSNYIYFEIDGQKYYNVVQEGSLSFLQGIALPQ